jgi:hypothetical protein
MSNDVVPRLPRQVRTCSRLPVPGCYFSVNTLPATMVMLTAEAVVEVSSATCPAEAMW